MPELDGFEVLELIKPGPAVIFVSFIRPIRHASVRRARGRLPAQAIRRRSASSARGVRKARLGHAACRWTLPPCVVPRNSPQRMVVKDGTRVEVLPLDKLDYVEARTTDPLAGGGKSFLSSNRSLIWRQHLTRRVSCESTARQS